MNTSDDLDRFPYEQFPKCIVLQAVYWYLRYALSYRDVEELMEERGIKLDHATVQRWVIKHSASLEQAFRKKKKRVGTSWRMDETYLKIKGKNRYLYRAVDKQGKTIDFMVTKNRDAKAAKRFLKKAIRANGVPEKITIDGSAANKSAIEQINNENKWGIEIRQAKYLNNIVEQDHRFIKRIIRPGLGFKSFRSAYSTLIGIELVHMIRKGQNGDKKHNHKIPSQQFYELSF